jgi:MYXO-CTERM domain-containing protein
MKKVTRIFTVLLITASLGFMQPAIAQTGDGGATTTRTAGDDDDDDDGDSGKIGLAGLLGLLGLLGLKRKDRDDDRHRSTTGGTMNR